MPASPPTNSKQSLSIHRAWCGEVRTCVVVVQIQTSSQHALLKAEQVAGSEHIAPRICKRGPEVLVQLDDVCAIGRARLHILG